MKHKSLSLSILLLLSLSSCKIVPWDDFTYYQKYKGNADIRMDRYYYHPDTNEYGPRINAFVLYHNGLYVNLLSHENHQSIQEYIINNKYDSTLTWYSSSWGAFIVEDDIIRVQRYSPIVYEFYLDKYQLFELVYHIKSKDSLVQSEGLYPVPGKKFGKVNRKYHFKEFNHKPDSTNNWIVNSDKLDR